MPTSLVLNVILTDSGLLLLALLSKVKDLS